MQTPPLCKAYKGCGEGRFRREKYSEDARLILGKVRVAPQHGSSVPRSELQAMVMLVKIVTTVLRAATFACSKVSLATD